MDHMILRLFTLTIILNYFTSIEYSIDNDGNIHIFVRIPFKFLLDSSVLFDFFSTLRTILALRIIPVCSFVKFLLFLFFINQCL